MNTRSFWFCLVVSAIISDHHTRSGNKVSGSVSVENGLVVEGILGTNGISFYKYLIDYVGPPLRNGEVTSATS